MGRHSRATHFQNGREDIEGQNRSIFLCGKKWTFMEYATVTAGQVNCPQCAAILGQRAIDARPAGAPVLAIGPRVTDNNTYRFIYPLLIGLAHRGFIVYDGAYGRGGWKLCDWWLPETGKECRIGQRLVDDTTRRYPSDLMFHSKEQALFAAGEIFAADPRRLRTAEQVIADRARLDARAEKRRIEDAAEDAAAEETRRETLRGLTEIRDAITLSNFQRVAIEEAILRFSKPRGE